MHAAHCLNYLLQLCLLECISSIALYCLTFSCKARASPSAVETSLSSCSILSSSCGSLATNTIGTSGLQHFHDFTHNYLSNWQLECLPAPRFFYRLVYQWLLTQANKLCEVNELAFNPFASNGYIIRQNNCTWYV